MDKPIKKPKLTKKKQKYIEGLADGKTKMQAALDAGYTDSMARSATGNIETPDVRAAFAKLIQERIPGRKIVDRIAEGLDAEETKFFQHEGVVTEQRNVVAWSERRQYAELAAEFGGYFLPVKAENFAPVIPVQVITNIQLPRYDE